MGRKPQLLDRWGRPVQRRALGEEISAPTMGGVRSPITGYPGDGLNPSRLAAILREADQGDPVRYLELAETIEERDPHYLGVLGTRRRSVSQIDITVEPGSDSALAERQAAELRAWLKRDELTDELFDILDAIGKGYSFTEIIWDTSMGQWQPERLEWRDPRWFRFSRHDLTTPMMLDDDGREQELPPFKFIAARMKAKSGLPLRSGIARVAAWVWMFKAFTQRDWAIFTQTYGQPLRVGKFGAGASEADKETLFRAVANIAGDCAAIIPESMTIDFVEAANVGASTGLYHERADWLDRQTSKLVLGQTATTDAVTGGLGSGREHREVQEDIERADAKAIAAILNRDLVRPWVELNYGPQPVYPRIVIARPEEEDLAAFAAALAPLVSAGLRVRQSELRAKFGLSDPARGDDILGPAARSGSPERAAGGPGAPAPSLNGQSGEFKRGLTSSRPEMAAQAERPSAGRSVAADPEELLADRLAEEAGPAMRAMLDRIEAMMRAAGSLEEFGEMLRAGYPDLDHDELAQVMAQAMLAADLAGRVSVAEEDEGA